MGDGEDDVSMIAVEKFFGKGLGPNIGILFSTTRTSFAFTTKRNDFGCAAVRANEGGKTTL